MKGVALIRLNLSIVLVLPCFLFNCAKDLSTGTRIEDSGVGWSTPEVLPANLYMAVKGIAYSNWGSVPDSEVQLELSMKYIRLNYSVCYFYQPTADTSCFYKDEWPMTYRHGLFSAHNGIGYLSLKNDTLRIRWIAEFHFDKDIEIFYVPCDTIPGPLCNAQGYPLQ